MAQYSVKFDTSQADKLRGVSSAVVGCAQRVTKVSSALKSDDSVISGFSTQAKTAASALQSLADRIKSEASAFEQAVGKYSACEKQNAALLGGGTVSAGALAGGGAIASLFLPQAHVVGKAVSGKNSKAKVKQTLFGKLGNLGKSAVKSVKGSYSNFKEAISPGGVLFRPYKTLKSIGDTLVGVTRITTGVIGLVASGGLSTPASLLAITYGFNKVMTGVATGTAAMSKDYSDSEVEKASKFNYLKSQLGSAGGFIGEKIGGQKGKAIGKAVGELVYITGDVYTSFVVGDAIKSIGGSTKAYYDTVKRANDYLKITQHIADGKPENILSDAYGDIVIDDGSLTSKYKKKENEKLHEESQKQQSEP